MFEIYLKHADRYDELVTREDYKGNLPATLHRLYDFTGKRVVELGTGTGRVTALYIDLVSEALCCDRSVHMLQRAKENLAAFTDKIVFKQVENLGAGDLLAGYGADTVIEGWAFGHTVSEHDADIDGTVDALVTGCRRIAGKTIIIESLGTNVEIPSPPNNDLLQFYTLLEEKHGFSREVVSTNYWFETLEDAMRIMGFFFGEEMGKAVAERGSLVIPEYTGIWYR
ncbi:MAG: class I SAM-dependent methyltransferase [Spirochaetales bacterium]|nr:class I SAM-dependent methyltransferase [Spirochaetales bacterium]